MILLYNDRIIPWLIVFLVQGIVLLTIRKLMKKHWKKRWYLKSQVGVILLSVIMVISGFFGKWVSVEKAATKLYSVKELQQDLQQLENVLFTKSPLYYTDKVKLQQEFDEVRELIVDEMTEEEFYRLVNPLVVDVLCGHTNLSISQALQKNREGKKIFFPLDVQVKQQTLVVTKDMPEYGIEVGDTISSINGKSTDEIIQILVRNISHDGDNEAVAYYILDKYFPVKYYDFIDQSEVFQVEVQKADGTKSQVSVEAVWNDAWNVNAWSLRQALYADGDYYNYSFDGDKAILRIRVFFEEKQSFKEFLKEFFEEVQEQDIHKIIIDVRGNFGGDSKMAKELLSYLIQKDFKYFRSKLPVMMKVFGYGKTVKAKKLNYDFDTELLIDGACFSTCGHFAAIYKSLGLGSVIGEPTGGGSLCTDGSEDIVLHNTGIRLHYSTTIFEVNADLEKKNVVEP